jgi:hypothetical protein
MLSQNPLQNFNNPVPIDLTIEEEAAKGALRLMANNHWINEPMLNQKGHLTTHTKRKKKPYFNISLFIMRSRINRRPL